MNMQKFTALTCGLVLCLGLSGCTDKNDNQSSNDNTATVSLVAYDEQKDNDYTIDYKINETSTVSAFEVAYAYENAVIVEAYAKEAVINTMTLDTNGKLVIDFKEDKVLNLGLGAAAESAVFENLIETIVLNCPEIKTIYFTMDGGNFETGHLSFAADKAAWSKVE